MKRIVAVLLCLLFVFMAACDEVPKEEGKIELVLAPTQALYIELEAGTKTQENFVTIAVTGEKTYFWDVKFVSTDEKIAKVKHERTENNIYLYYTIEAIDVGETYVYFEAEDGSVRSEMIRVRVYKTPETTTPEVGDVDDSPIVYVTKTGTKYHYKKSCAGTNAIEMSLTEASATRTPCKICVTNEEETTAPPETSAPEPEVPADPTVVYVTPSGTRYHYSQSHAGKNAIETTLSEAVADGKTPCKTCVPQSETEPEEEPPREPTDGQIVYVTPSGTKYHYSQSHAGKNATETTLDEALAAGKTPCKVCVK